MWQPPIKGVYPPATQIGYHLLPLLDHVQHSVIIIVGIRFHAITVAGVERHVVCSTVERIPIPVPSGVQRSALRKRNMQATHLKPQVKSDPLLRIDSILYLSRLEVPHIEMPVLNARLRVLRVLTVWCDDPAVVAYQDVRVLAVWKPLLVLFFFLGRSELRVGDVITLITYRV